jgi:periplasmic copper chaperone A
MKLKLLVVAALLWGCAPEPEPTAPPLAADDPGAVPEAAAAATEPMITDAWIRSVPPSARMTAGYLSLYNPGPDELVIVGVESALFGSIELHGTVMEDGVARMRHQDSVTVPAGEVVRFEPGGLHLMLMQPREEIPSSGSIEMSVVLENGERMEFLAQVGQPVD